MNGAFAERYKVLANALGVFSLQLEFQFLVPQAIGRMLAKMISEPEHLDDGRMPSRQMGSL